MYVVFLLLSATLWLAFIFTSPLIAMAIGVMLEIYTQNNKISETQELIIRIVCELIVICLVIIPIVITVMWR